MVHYVDLPVYGTPMSLAWKKHRMCCVNPSVPEEDLGARGPPHRRQELPVDHEGRQVGDGPGRWGPHRLEVAAELACDWHTVNDAVITYGEALLGGRSQAAEQDHGHRARRDLLRQAPRRSHTDYATTVADVENHQIIDILPTRKYADVAGWIDKQPKPGRSGSASAPSTCRPPTRRSTRHVAQGGPGGRPLPRHLAGQPLPRLGAPAGAERTDRSPRPAGRPALSGPPGLAMGEETARRRGDRASVVTARAGRSRRRGGHCLSGQRAPARLLSNARPRPGPSRCSKSSSATA